MQSYITLGATKMRVFDPWVGSKYWTEGLSGVRVFVLGESHYGDAGTESRSFTTDVVKEWAQEKRHRFFTVTQKLVSGLGSEDWITDEQRAEFWELVAFYNFVQAFPGSEPRQRPTPEMWSGAAVPFLATVQELKPHLVVVLGYKLQSNLPTLPEGIHVCSVQHPSSRGFQYEQWQSAIRLALQSAAGASGTQQGASADRLASASLRQDGG